MCKWIVAVLFAWGGLVGSPAFSQTAPNPTQRPVTTPQDEVPVFRVTVVGRTTPAINFRPRRGETRIDLAGTPLMPTAEGRAEISGRGGYMRIELDLNNLTAPTRYGPEYLTYVLWGITPEGRTTNLGEVQFDGDDARLTVTTELQAFGLIITAEPYFAVTQPSDVVVMENVVDDDDLRVDAVQAKYELLQRGTYLMNQDPSALQRQPLEPGAPLDLAEARNAVALARLAGADRFAEDTFARAQELLIEAETARERGRSGNDVMQPARQAVQTAEDARLIALRRQEEAFIAEQRVEAERRQQALEAQQQAAAEQARLEADRRRQAELAAQTEELRRREAELAAQAAAAERAAAERERAEAEAARAAAEAERLRAEAALQAAEAARAQSERDQDALREQLRAQLNAVLETRETARGLIVNLSDVLFSTGSATLTPGARERLARVSGIVLSHPGLEINVEGHTDSVGSDSFNQDLSERRAASVRDYLVQQGIPPAAVGTSGFGESRPVAPNETAQGRQMNRRVELVVTGDIINR